MNFREWKISGIGGFPYPSHRGCFHRISHDLFCPERRNSIVAIPGANNLLTPEYILEHQQGIDAADIIVLQMELAPQTPLNFVSHVRVNHGGWSRSGGMLISRSDEVKIRPLYIFALQVPDKSAFMFNSTSVTSLQSKSHFHILDGLRGIAALSVVVFHYLEWIYPDFTKNFIGHGFLAVDFFFCLSGFVIAYAYDNRLPAIGRRAFFAARLIRLHPLVIAGTIIGLAGLLFDPFGNHSGVPSVTTLGLIFVCSLLLIPLPIMQERGFNLFGLNAPSWSLFWEYIANILYAFVFIRLSRRMLWIILVPAAAAIVWVSYRSGNLLGGWNGSTFADGGIRMTYSFLAGLLLFRSGWIIKNKLGFGVLSLLLAAAFMTSGFPESWLVEILIVLFYFPFIVALGAGSVLSGSLRKVCVFLGKISYPLYMTHYGFIWWFGNYYTTKTPSPGHLLLIITAGTVAMVFFAWLVMVFYEMPLRNFLNRKRKEK